MEKWSWSIKGYSIPQIAEKAKKTPKSEQWIYCHRCRRETDTVKTATFSLKEKLPDRNNL